MTPAPAGAPLPLRFVVSARRAEELPTTSAEVAIAGRSNVGKSSLINALANRRDLAKTSSTPGRTQLLNLFSLGGTGTEGSTAAGVVDLPGYGYTAVPRRVRSAWPAMVEGYLLGRSQLTRVMVLVDGQIGPTKLDVQMLAWLQAHGLDCAVVATKHDKVRPSQRARRSADLAAGCGLALSDVLWVSAARGTGVDRLRAMVLGWLTAPGD